MEKHDFLPRTAPLDGSGPRDLPPTPQVPLEIIPPPRMDQAMNRGLCSCTGRSANSCHAHDSAPIENGPGNGCGCGLGGGCTAHEGCTGLSGHPLAMVYAPCQSFQSLYDTDEALMKGTLFTELDLPFGMAAGARDGGCICRTERRGV